MASVMLRRQVNLKRGMAMARQQIASSILDVNVRARTAALVSATILATLLAVVPAVQAQTFQVLHNFTGGTDGFDPYGGLTIDRSGKLYGTTTGQLSCGAQCGTVYRLSQQGSGWIFATLYVFPGGVRGIGPASPVTIAADGSLYGTTSDGGLIGGCYGYGCGTVYHLQPPAAFCKSVSCPWTETVLYTFKECPDLYIPASDGVAFNQAGDIFGAPSYGGLGCQDDNYGDGGLFELTPSAGGWDYQVIYKFSGNPDGCRPIGTVLVDQAGNMFGTTYQCGANGDGAVYQVSPSGAGWSESILYSFDVTHGYGPAAGLISDSAGNLYGTTAYGGSNGWGVVFELSPANGSYTYSVLYNFSGGVGPISRLSMDAAGNLYGAQYHGGANNLGMIFKLTSGSGGWTFTDLHDFSGNDGEYPVGNLALDGSGNLYGTASSGGPNGDGVIWEIMP